MRIQQITCLTIDTPDHRCNLFIGESATAHLFANGLMRVACLAEEIQNAGKIARIAHIHRVGDGLYRRPRRILAALQVVQKDIVAVVGRNETLDRQSHPLGKESRCNVAEVTARHGNHHFVCLAQAIQLCIRVEIVEGLRQETSHVDRIGRGEAHLLGQFAIHEGLLHHGLAVVEHTVDLQGRDILAQSRKLALLNRTYLALRIEHIDVDAGDTEEAIGYGTARIA